MRECAGFRPVVRHKKAKPSIKLFYGALCVLGVLLPCLNFVP